MPDPQKYMLCGSIYEMFKNRYIEFMVIEIRTVIAYRG